MKRTTSEKLNEIGVTLSKQEEGKPRRFRMVAYTGTQFSRMWGQMMIDLDGIEKIPSRGLPALLDHQSQPVGVYDKMSIEKGEGLVLEGYFLDTPHAKHVQSLADQGFPWTASVGVKCLLETEVKEGAELKVNGQTVKGPAYVWSKCKLYETSFITAGPADDATQVEVMTRMADLEDKTGIKAPVMNLAEEKAKLRIEILAENDAKKKVYVESLLTAGVKKSRAREWFDDGISIEQAFAKHAEVMRTERDEALAKVDHLNKHGKLDDRDAARVKAGISKGFEPEKLAKKNRIIEKLETGKADKLSKREMRFVEEKLEAYREWAQKNDDGLLMRSIFPRHQGGHELLHAVNMAEDNTALKLRAASKGLPLAPPYWIGDGFVEKLADLLIEGSDKFNGKGFVEKLAGTWGKGGHAYSAMTVKGYLAALFKPLEDDIGKGWAQRVGITIPSNQEIETYRFLGNPPQIRKWVGNRQTKFMPFFEQLIKNDTYEGTVDFPVNDFRFDKSGQIMLRMGELGIRARQHWDVLGTQVLLNNPTAYDGITLFQTNATHTQGGGFNMKNSLTAADVPALSVSSPTNPTQQEMVAAIMGVIQYFYTFQDQTGSPINGDARKFVVMVPPNLWGPAMTAVRAARLNYGQDNPLHEQDYSVDVIPNGWLVTGLVGASNNTNFFYVFRVDSQFRPIVFQDVTGWEAQMLGPGSDTTVMKDRIVYGLRAVRGAGPGEWAHALKAVLS